MIFHTITFHKYFSFIECTQITFMRIYPLFLLSNDTNVLLIKIHFYKSLEFFFKCRFPDKIILFILTV